MSDITYLIKDIQIKEKLLQVELNLKNYALNDELSRDFEDLNAGDYNLTLQFEFFDEFLTDIPIVTILKPKFDLNLCTMLN